MPSFRSGIQRAAGPRGGLKAHGPLYWQKPSTFSCWFFSGLRPQHPGRALQRSPKGRLGPVSPHLSPWCLTSRQGEESGHCLSRSSGPRLFFPGFFEVTPAAVTFPELSWVPLIHAWTGHRGRQWCGCCAPGSGDLRLACDSPGAGGPRSLSCKSGSLSRTEDWACASGVQSSIRGLWTSGCRVSLLKAVLVKAESLSRLRSVGQAPQLVPGGCGLV